MSNWRRLGEEDQERVTDEARDAERRIQEIWDVGSERVEKMQALEIVIEGGMNMKNERKGW